MLLQITDSNFQKEVLDSSKLVMLVFISDWSAPSKTILTFAKELAKEYIEKAVIATSDVEESKESCGKYNIRSVPVILFLKNGEMVDKIVGASTKSILEEKLKTHLQ